MLFVRGYNKIVLIFVWAVVLENRNIFWNFYIIFSAKFITWIKCLCFTSTFLLICIMSKKSNRKFSQRKTKQLLRMLREMASKKSSWICRNTFAYCLFFDLKEPLHYKFHRFSLLNWYYVVLRISNIGNYTDLRCIIL